jgi:membrane protease YdiL (CAAX protease family)
MANFFTNKSFWLQFSYLLLFIIGGVIIFGSLTVLMGQLGLETAIGYRWYFYVIQSIGAFGMFFVPAMLFSYCASKKWLSYSKADKIAPLQLVGYVLILSLLILPVIACLGYFNEQISFPESMHNIEMWMRKMEDANKMILQRLTKNSTIPILLTNLVIMAIFPALFEEFLFRGTLQPFFTKWFANKHVAIIVTAFIFSAIHFQFYGFIPRFLLGIYLGYLFVWGKSLWLPIIAHFMHNAVTLILVYGAQQRGIDLNAMDPGQIQGFYPFVIFCTTCIGVGIYYLWRKSQFRH